MRRQRSKAKDRSPQFPGRGTASKSRRQPSVPGPPARGTVFLNLAYGRESEQLLLAYIAGLTALGLTPILAIESSYRGRRLDHIRMSLRRCQYSLHDLHYVGAKRWNMILELGMAIECSKQHQWFVLDADHRRAIRALSDLHGTDIYEHHGTPTGVFNALLNVFSHRGRLLTVRRLQRVYDSLLTKAVQVQVDLGSKSPFERQAFKRLVMEAGGLQAKELRNR
jgi:hypothetical protein